MALSAFIAFEVRTTGNDNNGGGFKTGASGTDYSQQDSAQWALTGIATSGAGNTFNYASAVATMVGNTCQIISGTNFTAGVYEITSVSVGVSVTVDRNCCTGVGASGVINIGGAFATIGKALPLTNVSGICCFVKNGTYNIGSGLSHPGGGSSAFMNRLCGYNTTRTDQGAGGRPTIKATAAIVGMTMTGVGTSIENFILDGNSKTGTQGILMNSGYGNKIINCWAKNWSSNGIQDTAGNNSHYYNEVSGCGSSYDAGNPLNFCYSHNNTGDGFYIRAGVVVLGCVAYSNSSYGFNGTSYPITFSGCIAHSNTSSGIRHNAEVGTVVQNCIMVNNGGYGLEDAWNMATTDVTFNYNAYYNNTSGNRKLVAAGPNDVILTGDPFTNAAGGDFSLNNTANQGAACRAKGYPGAGIFGTGYADIGAVQHQDAGTVPSYNVDINNVMMTGRISVMAY